VIAAAVETSRPNVDQQGHTLTTLVPPEPIRLRGDFARVAQVLANLINNAAKYTPRGGRISVSAEREDREVIFRVRDSGVGIPEQFLGTIFEPFQRGSSGSGRPGSGLGLAIVRGFVQANRGRVWAESDGRGATFYLALPTVEAAVEIPT